MYHQNILEAAALTQRVALLKFSKFWIKFDLTSWLFQKSTKRFDSLANIHYVIQNILKSKDNWIYAGVWQSSKGQFLVDFNLVFNPNLHAKDYVTAECNQFLFELNYNILFNTYLLFSAITLGTCQKKS